MFSGATTTEPTVEFVKDLRASRRLDVSTLVFETLPSAVLDEADTDIAVLIRKLEVTRVAIAGVRSQRRCDPVPPPDGDEPAGEPTGVGDDEAPPPPPPPAGEGKAARRAARIAEALKGMPHTKAAFDDGRLSVDQVNQLARLASDPAVGSLFTAGERELVAAVVEAGPDRTGAVIRDWRSRAGSKLRHGDAKARHRGRSAREWTDDDGFSHLHFSGADAFGARVIAIWRQLLELDWTRKPTRADPDAPVDERTRQQRGADLFAHALSLALAAMTDGVQRPRPRDGLLVKVDHDDLVRHGGGVELRTQAPVSATDIAKMCCDAGIARIVTMGESVPLDKGRAARLATREQRLALAAIYRTCARPGCEVPFWWSEIHHIDEFVADLGETNIDDLLPQCNTHHHDLHHGGHHIERGRHPGEKYWVTPDGTRHRIRPDPPIPKANPPAESADRAPPAFPPGQLDLLTA